MLRTINRETGALCSFLHKQLTEQDIDFVAKTYSDFHSIGIDAFVYDLAQRINKKPKGIIVIVPLKLPSGQYRHVSTPKSFACHAYADIDLVLYAQSGDQTTTKAFYKQILDRISRYYRFSLGSFFAILHKKKGRKLFFLSAAFYDLNDLRVFSDAALSRKYAPVFVLVEEGVSTYVTDEVKRLINKRSADLQEKPRMTSRILNHLMLRPQLFDLLSRFFPTEDRLLFHRINGTLVPNTNTIEFYKKAIKCRARLTPSKDQDEVKSAIIVTHPYSEDSFFSVEFELSFVQELIELLNRNSIHPVIKPHPTEQSHKYDSVGKKNDVSILKAEFPVEEILLAINPTCVIGTTSTALLTANLLYDIPAISVVEFFLNRSDDKLLQLSGHQFKKLAEGYVHFASSTAELEQLVRNISSS
jgi:Alpha-2,8-polysialyltransferase (POLYST)